MWALFLVALHSAARHITWVKVYKDLESLIADWGKTLARSPGLSKERLEELENHLREVSDQRLRQGMTELEAFESAVAQLGPADTISSEFQKLKPTGWLPAKAAIILGVGVAVTLMVFLTPRIGTMGGLLATHVFTVTLGYVTTLLLGGLGACFVIQRCFLDFSDERLQYLGRVSFLFTITAAFLTAVGILLGAIWTKQEWNRYWAWDLKETTGLCVLVWLMFSALLQRLGKIEVRGALCLSLVGSAVVSVAWFGPNLLAGLGQYGTTRAAIPGAFALMQL